MNGERKRGRHKKHPHNTDSSDDASLELKYSKQLKLRELRFQEKIKSKTDRNNREEESSKTNENANEPPPKAQEENFTPQFFNPMNIQFPISDIDEIIAEKDGNYLVKLRNVSYLNLQWISSEEILSHMNGTQVLQCFKDILPTRDPPFYNLIFNKPELVVKIIDDMCLVKWKSLGFKYCTWESLSSFTNYVISNKTELDSSITKPIWFFNLDKKYQPAVLSIAQEFGKTKNIILSGTVGSIMRLQLYSVMFYISRCLSNNPFLIAVEDRILQVVEAEIKSRFNMNILVLSNTDDFDEIQSTKENAFVDNPFDIILISIEALQTYKESLDAIQFSIAAIDMTEIYGRIVNPSNQIEFGIEINAEMKICLSPLFARQNGKIINSQTPQNIEEFSWIISPNYEMVKRYTELPTNDFFDCKNEADFVSWASKFHEITNFTNVELFKNWDMILRKILDITNRSGQISTLTQLVSQSNSKLGSILNVIPLIPERSGVLLITSSTEISTFLQSYFLVKKIPILFINSLNDFNETIHNFHEINVDTNYIIMPPGDKNLDLKENYFDYILILDPQYCPDISIKSNLITTVVRMVIQSSEEVILFGARQSLKPQQIVSYTSQFLWKPIRERPLQDYSEYNFLLYERFGKHEQIPAQTASVIDNYYVHGQPTKVILKIFENPQNINFKKVSREQLTAEFLLHILRTLNIYCLGQWFKFGFNGYDTRTVKTAIYLVVITLMNLCDMNFPLLSNFIKNSNFLYLDEYKEPLEMFIRDNCKPKDIRSLLIRIEKLLIISNLVSCSKQAPNQIYIKETDLYKPAPWWSLSDDQELIYRTWFYGYGKMPVSLSEKWSVKGIRIESELISQRLRTLTFVIRREIEKLPNKLGNYPIFVPPVTNPPNIRLKFNVAEQLVIAKQLLSFGKINSEELLDDPLLANKKKEDIEHFAEILINVVKSGKSNPYVKLGIKTLTNIGKIMTLFSIAESLDFTNMFCEDRILVETVMLYGLNDAYKSNCLPALLNTENPSKELILENFERVVKNAAFPSSEDFVQKICETPIPAGVDTLVLSLGKIDTRSSFSNQSYIYPIGFSITTTFCGEPIACEIKEEKSSPIFVVRRETNEEEFIGTNPDEAVRDFVAAVAPQRFDYIRRTPGHEVFGLCSCDVLRSIQSMRNADKCQKYKMRVFADSLPTNDFPRIFSRWRFGEKRQMESPKPENTGTLDLNHVAQESDKLNHDDWLRILNSV
ncbi:hypothetical protein TVAG_173380 [Trichomonas vaginalis G3]|uniref:Uncharacterized protein n=1 Tax=Trichomonas vaginalis (strain ATCC PRA-98 / G3) TaxID=412133 RepID=A2G3H1_TRIV3|nr:transforming growth factor beta regulated gene 1 family protein [Trichomonas vaginalis G3]EAX88299.1 hypothetical protein TVAG_173380 [Trichomonas vaginalis G3]KAI5511547.1 transforming growth factor beta regulated gene 1 family protein [Trichomonas vaginalis G3]|eukprot:XP_001301229.1 hypothetical protein [Trichomonas vaginalis G3]